MLSDHEGPLAIVVTDIVDSTRRTTSQGDRAARDDVREHDELVRSLVSEHHGHDVKALGDGFLLAFPSVRRALDFSIALQQALVRESFGLLVRIGVNTGEVIVEDGDVHGQAVNAAARIAAAASGGEILVSDVTRQLIGQTPELRLEDVGEQALKGFPQPWRLHRLQWRPVETVLPFPEALAQARPAAFVGRDDVLSALEEHLQSPAPRPLVLLAGEPGIGKTGATAEFAGRAHESGVAVLFGRCDEDTVVPYQPFTDMLRQALQTETLWGSGLPPGAGVLRPLLPDLAHRLPPAPSAAGDPEAGRYQLFEAVGSLVRRMAPTSPLVLVLDDLHWADRPTLLLLQHVLRSCSDADLLVVGTYRDTDLDRRHPLSAVLAELRRRDAYVRIPMRGLPVGDIQQWLERTAQHELGEGGARLARALWDETEGNPFFVTEVVRHLIEVGGIFQDDAGRWTSRPVKDLGLPEGVREVVGRRLSRLSEHGNDVLAAASVLGRSAHVDVLPALARCSRDEVLAALDEAVAASLVEPDESGRVYEFTHALVRETLYEELSLPAKQRLHLLAAEQLGSTAGAGASAATVASHYRLAGVAAEPRRVADAMIAAAEESYGVTAYEEAVDHWLTAAEILDRSDGDQGLRARVLERAGDVSFVAGLDHQAGVAALDEALALHRGAGRTRDQARLRSKLGRTYVRSVFDMDTARALEHFRAARELSGDDRQLRAYALVGLASTRLWRGEWEEGRVAAEEALELADQLGERLLYANAAAFLAWHVSQWGRMDEAYALMEESWAIGVELDSPYVRFQAAWMGEALAFNAFAAADATRWISRVTDEPWLVNAPLQSAIARAQLTWTHVLRGELDTVRENAQDPMVGGQGLTGIVHLVDGDVPSAVEAWMTLSRERGGPTQNYWDYFPPHAWSGQAEVRLGDARDGRRHLEAILDPPVGRPSPLTDLQSRPVLALAHLALGDAARAQAEIDTCRGHLVACRGAPGLSILTAMAAGSVAASTGDSLRANGEYRGALQTAGDMGNRWYEGWILHEWGRGLSRLDDAEGAANRLDGARTAYEEMRFAQPWLDLVARDRAALA